VSGGVNVGRSSPPTSAGLVGDSTTGADDPRRLRPDRQLASRPCRRAPFLVARTATGSASDTCTARSRIGGGCRRLSLMARARRAPGTVHGPPTERSRCRHGVTGDRGRAEGRFAPSPTRRPLGPSCRAPIVLRRPTRWTRLARWQTGAPGQWPNPGMPRRGLSGHRYREVRSFGSCARRLPSSSLLCLRSGRL
jgi:hypothetical protein